MSRTRPPPQFHGVQNGSGPSLLPEVTFAASGESTRASIGAVLVKVPDFQPTSIVTPLPAGRLPCVKVAPFAVLSTVRHGAEDPGGPATHVASSAEVGP